jgi:hypothetical protein
MIGTRVLLAVQILSKTQAELPHKDSAVAKDVNSWLPKPFGASTKSRHSDHMLSKIQILENLLWIRVAPDTFSSHIC